MKKLAAFLFGVLKAGVLFILLALLFNGLFLKTFLAGSLGLYWDTDITIKQARIDWTLPAVVLKQIEVGNPYGFPRGNMLAISQATIHFAKGQPFLEAGTLKPSLVDIQVRHIELMRRVSGHLNLERFSRLPQGIKRRGLKVNPARTRFVVDEIEEVDTSTPILMRKQHLLQNKQFVYRTNKNFANIAQAFADEFLQRIGAENGTVEKLAPAPEYHGITDKIEQKVRVVVSESHAKETADDGAEKAAANPLI